jgi:dienelactone hydrolase
MPKAEPPQAPLNHGDSVELLVGRSDTIDRFLVVVSPGRTPLHPELRPSLVDMRQQMEDRARPLKAVVAATANAEGYVVEALLPWENLHVQPRAGLEMLAQVRVNDAGDSGQLPTQFRWNPGSSSTIRSMSRIRLAEAQASPAVEAAASGRYEHLHRIRAAITATQDAVGKPVEILDDTRVLTSGTLVAFGAGSAASVVVPMPARGKSYGTLSVRIGGRVLATLSMQDVTALRENALADDALLFKEFIFSGNRFPDCDFENPVLVDDLLGPYTLVTTFYDSEFKVVKQPTKPGRYGAVVEARPEGGGPVLKRFCTLYHTAGPEDWKFTESMSRPRLPAELGISTSVAERQSPTLLRAWDHLLKDQAARDPTSAVVLAGLYDLPSDAPALLERDSPAECDRQWWYQLKRRTGNFEPLPYLTYLPKGYEQESQRRWPLVLSLHGADERGLPLESLKAYGIPFLCEKGQGGSFIAICPQCPPRESWLAASLNDLLDEVSAKYRVDPDRIYVTGASMGGNGTWNFAQQYPNRIAAIAPVCGGGDPEDVARLKDVPVWIFHGEADPVVPFRRARAMFDALSRIGGRVKITSYPGVGHESWNAAYATPDLIPWLLAQRRGHPQQPSTTAPVSQPAASPGQR